MGGGNAPPIFNYIGIAMFKIRYNTDENVWQYVFMPKNKVVASAAELEDLDKTINETFEVDESPITFQGLTKYNSSFYFKDGKPEEDKQLIDEYIEFVNSVNATGMSTCTVNPICLAFLLDTQVLWPKNCEAEYQTVFHSLLQMEPKKKNPLAFHIKQLYEAIEQEVSQIA